MNLDLFKKPQDLYQATLQLFTEQLNIKVSPVPYKKIAVKDYFGSIENKLLDEIDNIFPVALVNDETFSNNETIEKSIDSIDYDTIFIVAIELKKGLNRSHLAQLTRLVNQPANKNNKGNPVIVIFRYDNKITLSSLERQARNPKDWHEGEKISNTKVSMLKDVELEKPHRAHLDILKELGTNKATKYEELYFYWQKVLNTKELNTKFYKDLSNWYFWATQHVTFPGEPTSADAHTKKAKLEDLIQEHRATNVIRMLTRLLFVWFIKEKKLIPDELFELDTLQKDILNDISPYHEKGMFKERNKESVYYKAILQNLFFATLNCPIEADSLDKRKRGFRGDGYGTHRGIDYLMRYKTYFKNPDAFLEKLNKTVPFLNGGLFECLDDKFNNIYIDGFSDQMTKGEQLIVPDYLFFGIEEEADISDIVGVKDKNYKQAAVKGLINILKSYKFTITENTPIEEDVALDPELLGKVFENLLASYNPETKTTARKQTGSFYTPREIVNYMVDESIIAYLKNKILTEPNVYVELGGKQSNLFGNEGRLQTTLVSDINGSELKNDEEKLDKSLHELVSFNPGNPFLEYPKTTKHLLRYLSECSILDPACGSGAFPMGILHKMVHILQKLDPENIVWREVQEAKAKQEAADAIVLENKDDREERLNEISEAFDQSINDPDYARKLFLIENCIYGVDIQPIATQISKLRFFISLVVEQKPSNKPTNNFNIKPLPNLETKFVAANTLIGIKKDGGLFETDEVKKLENELKLVRHKIFSLKSKERKIAWREKDKDLREKLSEVLRNQGLPLDAAEKLAGWDPYDQNASSPFFDSEWMFGLKEGFDVVIGNPPYVDYRDIEISLKKELVKYEISKHSSMINLYNYFFESSLKTLKTNGTISFITPQQYLILENCKGVRDLIRENTILFLSDFARVKIFDASTYTFVSIIKKEKKFKKGSYLEFNSISDLIKPIRKIVIENPLMEPFSSSDNIQLLSKIENISNKKLGEFIDIFCASSSTHIKSNIKEHNSYYFIQASDIFEYYINLKECFIKLDGYSINSFNKQMNEVIYTFRMTNKIRASILNNKEIIGGKVNVLFSINDNLKNKFILCLLNSTLMNFWYRERYNIQHMQGGALPINTTEISLIPLPIIPNNQLPFITIVNQILECKNIGQDSSHLEHQINVMVYHLYKLSYEEACVIDQALKREDFERYNI